MLTTRQHERYQFALTGISLALYVLSELNNRYLLLYGGITLTTFLNQYILLSKVHSPDAPWLSHYDALLSLISLINIFFFFWSVYLAIRYFRDQNPQKAESVPPLPSEPAVPASSV